MCLIIIKNLMNNNIIMNDSMSILLATTILALGGLGLYMFRMTQDDEDSENKHNKNKDADNKEDKNDEETIFDTSTFFSWGASDDKDENQDTVETEESEIKPRKKTNTKTQRNRKSVGTSRRRY